MTTAEALFIGVLFIVAVGLTTISFIFKKMFLSYSAGLLWAIIGIQRLTVRNWDMDIPLGIFLLLLAVTMPFTPMLFRTKEPPEPTKTYRERLADRAEALRKARGSNRNQGDYW